MAKRRRGRLRTADSLTAFGVLIATMRMSTTKPRAGVVGVSSSRQTETVRLKIRVNIIGFSPSDLMAIGLIALVECRQVMCHDLSCNKAVPCISTTPRIASISPSPPICRDVSYFPI